MLVLILNTLDKTNGRAAMPVTAFTPEIFGITYPSYLQNLSHIGFHLTGKTTKSISR